MRYIGIDYGSKRIGIAVSDDQGTIAFPKTTILNRGMRPVLIELRFLVEKEHIEYIVVGLPLSTDGTETKQTKIVRLFADAVEDDIPLPVDFENEMLTSRLVEREGVSKEHIDESSAAVILQSYLDKQKKQCSV
ncbi:MAG: Holliday junction resolvase RuvX [bacterium]|nr:Holliday junction resolvase RuvX [bacterium]